MNRVTLKVISDTVNLFKFILQTTLESWVICPNGVNGPKNVDYWMSSLLSLGFELVSTELTSISVNPAKIPFSRGNIRDKRTSSLAPTNSRDSM